MLRRKLPENIFKITTTGGVRTHAGILPLDLKSNALTTRPPWCCQFGKSDGYHTFHQEQTRVSLSFLNSGQFSCGQRIGLKIKQTNKQLNRHTDREANKQTYGRKRKQNRKRKRRTKQGRILTSVIGRH